MKRSVLHIFANASIGLVYSSLSSGVCVIQHINFSSKGSEQRLETSCMNRAM